MCVYTGSIVVFDRIIVLAKEGAVDIQSLFIQSRLPSLRQATLPDEGGIVSLFTPRRLPAFDEITKQIVWNDQQKKPDYIRQYSQPSMSIVVGRDRRQV